MDYAGEVEAKIWIGGHLESVERFQQRIGG
jgi:hypothetical protein